jgi:HlyD family secretion protein
MAGILSRRVWGSVGVVVVCVAGLLYLNGRRPVPTVRVVNVSRTDLKSVIASNGKVEPVAPATLRAKFDGFVIRVAATEGQTVRQGELLLVLDDTQVRSQLEQARAQLAAEQADLRLAQSGGRADEMVRLTGDLRANEAQRDLLQRQQDALTKLVAEHAATPDELEKNRAALERARADVEHLRKSKEQFDQQAGLDRERLTLSVAHWQTEVKNLQEKVASAQIVAPQSGVLFSLPVHVQDFVHTGDLLADLADLRNVRVRAFVDEPELGGLTPGQPVEVTWDALPDRTWTGRTDAVPQQVVARGSRNVGELLCSISNTGMELKPNTTVNIRIQLKERKGVLAVPRAAIEVAGSSRYVYLVAGGNRLQRKEIKVGLANDTQFEIADGIKENDAVALPGDVPLKDGMTVQIESAQ